jgi:hypothetical protein
MAPRLVKEVLVCEAQYEVHLRRRPKPAGQPRLFIIYQKIKKKSGHSGGTSVTPRVRPYGTSSRPYGRLGHCANILPNKIDVRNNRTISRMKL